MSSELSIDHLKEPVYYQREYSNDIGSPPKDLSWSEQTNTERLQRVANVAIPIVAATSKTLNFPISLGLGAMRTVSCVSQLASSIQAGNDKQAITYKTLQTAVAIASLAGTIFAHPLGMLITTGQDLLIDVAKLSQHVRDGDYKKAMETSASIVSNTLYLTMFLRGGIELSIASLGMQVLMEIYRAQDEFRGGRYLEGTGHVAMAMIRGHQATKQIEIFIAQSAVQKQIKVLLKEIAPNSDLNTNSLNNPDKIATSAQATVVETRNVWIHSKNGYNFHVADYGDGTRIVTCLDGPGMGYQGISYNGVLVADSIFVTWYAGYFVHKYAGGFVYSYRDKQIVQIN